MDTDVRLPKRPRQAAHTAVTPSKTETTFRTPEEVAAEETLHEASDATDNLDLSMAPTRKPNSSGWRQKLALHWPPGKKEYLVVLAVILLGGLGTFLVISHHHKPFVPAIGVIKPKVVKPTTVASDLSGLQVNPSLNKLPVTAVMIENSTDARPQSGLSQAGVVFEAIAEGGVTRFMALYQDTSPSSVGPIRSARPYYVQWALGFDAGYAHVGGSPDALADIKAWDVRDLDQFANGSSYQRVTTRAAPHNVYTSISALNQLEDKKGYTSSTFTGFPRKTESPSKQPTAQTINLTLSGPVYNVHYDYNAKTNSYDRSEGGAAQVDANGNARVSPKVVIAMVTPETQGALDASGAYYSDYATIGSGPVSVFQDGTVTTGQWAKAGNTNQITFVNGSGQAIKLNPGQTWLTAVSLASDISYAP